MQLFTSKHLPEKQRAQMDHHETKDVSNIECVSCDLPLNSLIYASDKIKNLKRRL